MKTTSSTYFFSVAVLFLSTCSDINQKVYKSHSENNTDAYDTLGLISGAFLYNLDKADQVDGIADERIKSVRNYQSAYLDSAANNLFYLKVDSTQANPYGFEEDEMVSYPDSIYRKRIKSISSELSLTYNEYVEDYIELYAFRKKDLTERMFGKSELYFPYIETVLAEMELPHKLKYLTMVESAMNADASSNMEAVGLWQIRYRTGRWLGLEINDYLDERRDPYASTHAALEYLERLYNMYGSWPMALAAYNSGPGNVNKAIVRSGGSRNYWHIRPYLPVETRSYVPAFMALVYLYEYHQEHNIRPTMREFTFQAVDTVRIYEQVSFAGLSKDLGIDEEELTFLNPALVRQTVPKSKEGYPLVIPMGKTALFEEYRMDLLHNSLPEEVAQTAQVFKEKKELVPEDENLRLIEYQVRRGNTIGSIARRYQCAISDIRDWNGKRNNIVRTGEMLKIYVPIDENGR